MDITVLSTIINAGLAGIVVAMLMTGALVTGREYGKLEKAYEKTEEALRTERQRNSDLMLWASTGMRAMQSVARVAEERSPAGSGTPPRGMPSIGGP